MSKTSDAKILERIYPLDSYHLGIRLIVLFSMIIGAIVGFILVSMIANVLTLTMLPRFWLGVTASIVLAFALGSIIERMLRSRWPSGRWLIISDNLVELHERDGAHRTISRTLPYEETRWYFVISRRRATVEKGWYCTACHLTQG